jgi:hypothetical protein
VGGAPAKQTDDITRRKTRVRFRRLFTERV